MMIEEFLNYLRSERNSSPKTIQSYGVDLRLFETYFKNLDSHLSWESVDSDVIRDWMESMMDKGHNATTINRRLSALRSFFRFALSRGFVARDPARLIKGPKKDKPLPKFVKEADMERLLQPEMWQDTYKDVRARTILSVFYETGVRVSELVGLDDVTVDFVRKQLKVTGKGNRQRVIPFGSGLEDTLREYMRIRSREVGTTCCGALFLTDRGERMSDGQVRYIVKTSLARVTSQKRRTPHVLRHTFATAMLNHDAGLESVRKLLGHQSLTTTEVYTHTTFEQLKRVYKNAHPRV